jgi:hypothetical protein
VTKLPLAGSNDYLNQSWDKEQPDHTCNWNCLLITPLTLALFKAKTCACMGKTDRNACLASFWDVPVLCYQISFSVFTITNLFIWYIRMSDWTFHVEPPTSGCLGAGLEDMGFNRKGTWELSGLIKCSRFLEYWLHGCIHCINYNSKRQRGRKGERERQTERES